MSKNAIIAIVAVVILAAAGLFFVTLNADKEGSAPSAPASTGALPDTQSAVASNDTEQESGVHNQDTPQPSADIATSGTDIDVEAALAQRSLGNPDAPVTILEFSSLTCGHCGDFHKNAFDRIKAEYIDAGKVQVIFHDFPLNGPALHATMAARCLPADRYFNFVDALFKNQDKWAYNPNYLNFLRQNAALAGLGNDRFEACINNDDLRNGLTTAMRENGMKYNINSTPSIVINNGVVHSGSRSFDFYKGLIEAELAKIQQQ